MSHPLDELLQTQKRGKAAGLPSLCSANPWVLKSALYGDAPVLVESTCNQVNQYGGYSGMTPADFVRYVHELARRNHFPQESVILGGDHLGPSPWQDQPVEPAMERAEEMVRAYVRAGYTKLHLDASMKLAGDDPAQPLEPLLVASRTAQLARAAESAARKSPQPPASLRYVIGSEVPIPGGARTHETGISVTTVEAARRTLEVMQTAFIKAGLDSAWERVLALVVQPGVEFGDGFIQEYKPAEGRDLALFSETTAVVYEAHSTDYQLQSSLRALVQDHFAILKVGPALTYAFREAVFSLAAIEAELVEMGQRSRLVETLEAAMLRNPVHWQGHYRGDEQQQAHARKFSLSDRARYYWPEPSVQAALETLLCNLHRAPIPQTLLQQVLPRQSERIREGKLESTPEALITDQIREVLFRYDLACGITRQGRE